MRNYSTDQMEQEMYIINYVIDGNKIIINYETGVKYIISHTKKNVSMLQTKMKSQAKRLNKDRTKIYERMTNYETVLVTSSMFFLASICSFIEPILNNGLISSLSVVASLGTGLLTAKSIYEIADCKKKMKSIEKNRLFFENERLFKKKVNSTNKYLLNDRIANKNKINSESPTININTINKMKYETLKKILLEIKRDEAFEFEQNSKKLQKTYKK